MTHAGPRLLVYALSHDPVDTPLQQFYDHEFGDAYMADRFQSMTIVPSDAVRG